MAGHDIPENSSPRDCAVVCMTDSYQEYRYGFATGSVADMIREFRCRAGLTQREVADRAGMSIGGLCDLEQRRVLRPRLNTLRRLADALELSTIERTELIQVRQQPPILAEDLQVRVLGPLSIVLDGDCVDPRSVRQRKLLGLLALSPGVLVSHDTLIEVLWGPRPPLTAANLLQTYVYRLRKRLSCAGVECAEILATRQGGYQLAV